MKKDEEILKEVEQDIRIANFGYPIKEIIAKAIKLTREAERKEIGFIRTKFYAKGFKDGWDKCEKRILELIDKFTSIYDIDEKDGKLMLTKPMILKEQLKKEIGI